MDTAESPPETAQSPPAISMTDPLPPSLLFFISNFHHLIPVKLTEQNYAIWKLQCEGALKASSLSAYIQESQAPSPAIVDSTGNSICNPMFSTWFLVETHLRSCLIATLTPDILTQVTHISTARDLWVFLKQKFEKSNSSVNSGLQPSAPVICQICNNSGHTAFDCGNRFVENLQPDNATTDSFSPSKTSRLASDYNANKVFDGSPNRDCLAIADGSAASDANTGSDIVPPSHGRTVLIEPEMSTLNQSDYRFVKDRLALSPEVIMGCHRQRSGNSEPFQKQSETKISDAQENVILMNQPENNLSGLKRKAPTSPFDRASEPSSDSSKKNKMVCFSANREKSAGNNSDIGFPSKENGNAVEHTYSTYDQQIQNSHDKKLEGKSLHVNKQLKGGKPRLLEGTTDDPKIQNSQEIQVEGNLLQANELLNGDKVIVIAGTKDDPKIQNSQELQARKYEEFMTLRQGSNSVKNYYKKFVELARFAEDTVATEERNVSMFISGLDFSIQKLMLAAEYPTIQEAYGRAASIWRVQEIQSQLRGKRSKENRGNNPSNPGKNNTEGPNKRIRPNKGRDNQNNAAARPARHYPCKVCNGDHRGVDCKGKLVECRTCGKKGHRAFECRKGKSLGKQGRNGGGNNQRLTQNNNQANQQNQHENNNYMPNNQYGNQARGNNNKKNIGNAVRTPQGNNNGNGNGNGMHNRDANANGNNAALNTGAGNGGNTTQGNNQSNGG